MIDIEVKGFQSIECACIKVEGFSALVGRSNIGKSAFVRAVRSALTNPAGTSFVRHGVGCARQTRKNGKSCKCSSSVHIQTSGLDLLWEKGDSINRYTFNGQIYDKPGQGVPDFLAESGFAPVKAGDKTGSIQVADQFFPIFLLDQSGPAIAEAISDVSRLDQINAATRLADKDRREAVAKRKVREGDVKELEGSLSSFDGFDTALQSLQEADEGFQALVRVQGKVQQLGRFLDAMESIVTDVRRLQEAASVDVDDPVELVTALVKAQQCLMFHEKLEVLTQESVKLGKASQVDVEDPDILSEKSSSVQTLRRYEIELVRRQKEVEGMSEIDSSLSHFPEEDPLLVPASSLLQFKTWMSKLQQLKSVFTSHSQLSDDISDPDGLVAQASKLKDLSSIITRLSPLPAVIRDLDSRAKSLNSDYFDVGAEIDALGVCPTCTRPLKEGHTHATFSVSV